MENNLGEELTNSVEYRNKSLTKAFGSPYLGCYALAVTIFSLGLIRDGLYVPNITSHVPAHAERKSGLTLLGTNEH